MKTNLFGRGMCVFFAFVVSSAHAVNYRIIDLGTLGGSFSVGVGVNNSGQVTGHSETNDRFTFHAFLYDGGTMQDLGTLGGQWSFGDGINATGQVIGSSLTTEGPSNAFLYEGGTMQNLGTLGGKN